RYGQRKPVVVRAATRTVIAGNGTMRAALALGWAEIAAVFVDDDAATATGYAIADNRTAELAAWDNTALSELLRTLEQEAGLAEFGLDAAWTTEEVDAIVASVTPPSEEDWADAFEQSGDTEHVDRVKQVTFVLDEQDHA